MKTTLVLTLALGLAATSVARGGGADNRVEVITNPAGSGFVLRGTAVGSTDRGYLLSNRPFGEHQMRWNFRLLLDTAGAYGPAFTMMPGDRFILLRAREDGTNIGLLRVELRRHPATGRYSLVGLVRRDTGGFSRVIQGLRENAYQSLAIEWVAAAGPGANDGLVRLRRGNGGPKLADGLDNDLAYVGSTLVGMVAGVDPTTSGSFYLDDFSSFRTLAP